MLQDKLLSLQKDLTQKEFANKIGVPLNTFTAWIRGERQPSFEAIQKICTALGVSADWLINDSVNDEHVEYRVDHSREAILKSIVEDAGKAFERAVEKGRQGELQTLFFHLANLFDPEISYWNSERAKSIIDAISERKKP